MNQAYLHPTNKANIYKIFSCQSVTVWGGGSSDQGTTDLVSLSPVVKGRSAKTIEKGVACGVTLIVEA